MSYRRITNYKFALGLKNTNIGGFNGVRVAYPPTNENILTYTLQRLSF